jgi:hypothetical protein
MRVVLSLCAAAAVASCAYAAGAGRGVIYGRVTLATGNCQPGTVGQASGCGVRGVSRLVYVYAPPLPTTAFGGTYYTGARRPAATVRSDRSGRYRLSLASGRYSVLVADRGARYCNFFKTYACVVWLRGGSRRLDVLIDHAAS